MSVRCDVHEWMRAWIFVSPHRFAAVTGEDGSFRFEGVPPGDHELRVWHERLGERRMRVIVAADAGSAVRVVF